MSAIVLGSKARWAAASAGAALAGAALVALFRAPALPPAPSLLAPVEPAATPARTPALSASPVELVRPDAANALAEEAAMRDLTPLFLPTERNASPRRLPLREPGASVLDAQPPKLAFTESAPNTSRDLPPVATLEGRPLGEAGPVDALRSESLAPALLGFGRDPVAVPTLPARGGFLEVVATTTALRVLAETLPVEARPATDQLWEPLEFVAAVDAAGLVTPLLVSRGSRVEEVDNHFKNYLVQRYRIGERLAPGFYRITVAP